MYDTGLPISRDTVLHEPTNMGALSLDETDEQFVARTGNKCWVVTFPSSLALRCEPLGKGVKWTELWTGGPGQPERHPCVVRDIKPGKHETSSPLKSSIAAFSSWEKKIISSMQNKREKSTYLIRVGR